MFFSLEMEMEMEMGRERETETEKEWERENGRIERDLHILILPLQPKLLKFHETKTIPRLLIFLQ